MNLMRKVSKMAESPRLHVTKHVFRLSCIIISQHKLPSHFSSLHGHIRRFYALFQSGPWSKVWSQVISNLDMIQAPFHSIQYSYVRLRENIHFGADLKLLIDPDNLLVLLTDLCSRARESNL
jgi:hypothetical protein